MDGNLLKNKDNIILELTDRIFEWNQIKCPECQAVLERKRPQLMEGREARSHEDRKWINKKSISETHAKGANLMVRLRQWMV